MITLNMGSDFAWQSEAHMNFHSFSMGYVHAPTYGYHSGYRYLCAPRGWPFQTIESYQYEGTYLYLASWPLSSLNYHLFFHWPALLMKQPTTSSGVHWARCW